MFDTIGITQHHDAVTGTGKQAVANDYSLRIFKSLQVNSVQYSKLVSEAAEKIAGVKSEGAWEWCT